MHMNTTDPVTRETLALIATGDNDAIGARCLGLSKIAREFKRLHLVAPSSLLDSIAALTFALLCDECGETGDRCFCDQQDALDNALFG